MPTLPSRRSSLRFVLAASVVGAAVLALTSACQKPSSTEASPAETTSIAPSTSTPTSTSSETDEQVATRARAELAPFKTQLRDALVSMMADGGPERAIDVCSSVAPKLAEQSATGGVRLGRAAERRRNANSTPPAWAAPLMADLARAPREGDFRVARLDGGRAGYVETIVARPMCLICHGDAIAPNIAARIAERYPNDQATKFHDGDFRGVFWAELPARAP